MKHFARFMNIEPNLKIVKEANRKHVELGKTREIYNLPSKCQVNMKEVLTRRLILRQ